MGYLKQALCNRKGDIFIFVLILLFFIFTVSAMLIEYMRIESLYEQVEYTLQRGVGGSVEYAILDEYRHDGYTRMDSELAEAKLYEYLYESMKLDAELNKYAGEQWVYQLEIDSIDATDDPPRLTLNGKLKTRSIFSFLTGEIRLPFSASSVNIRIEEGGSP